MRAKKRRARGRAINGILLLDKPAGKSSNQVLQIVKRQFDANKAGHTGSLDGAATGLLPICFGHATKLSGFLLDADKYYRATCKLGVITTTGDAEGDIIEEKPVGKYSVADIKQVLAAFVGDIEQIPPMYSALKHNGQRLYKLAHQGVIVERKPRRINIYNIDLIDHTADTVTFEVRCSKGTYIRTLAEDIGVTLGCGAHVQALRRLGSGPFTAEQMVTMGMIEAAANHGSEALEKLLLPMDAALMDLDAVHLDENVAYYLRLGQAVVVPRAPTEGLLRIYDEQDIFFAIGEVMDDGRIAPKRLMIS